jgi:hypothetical protein
MSPVAVRAIIVVLFCAITVAWKAMIPPRDPDDVSQALVDFLSRQKFQAFVTDRWMESMAIVEASSESCHLRAARVSPIGPQAELVRRMGDPTDKVSFVFRGRVYEKQPISLTEASYLWFRFLRELNLVRRVPPVIAVVSSCSVKHLPWELLFAVDEEVL